MSRMAAEPAVWGLRVAGCGGHSAAEEVALVEEAGRLVSAFARDGVRGRGGGGGGLGLASRGAGGAAIGAGWAAGWWVAVAGLESWSASARSSARRVESCSRRWASWRIALRLRR